MTSTHRERRSGAGDATPPSPSEAHLDLLAEFSSELERLSATQRELLQELRSDSNIDLDSEAMKLRKENVELRQRVQELERLLGEGAGLEDVWAERQGEYEKLLEEKSELIRELHVKLQTAQAAPPPPPVPVTAEQVHDAAVARMREELEEQRRQLQEDEAAMTKQMREMELALAKDRADMARLRSDLQRQQAEFNREMEQASRSPDLQDRLATLRRRPAEAPAVNAAAVTAPTPPRSSGLIRRLFG